MSKKYQVIGGQYHAFNYGESNYLLEAKKIASEHVEDWGCFGLHRPEIYIISDCELASNFYGEQIVPKFYALPFLTWSGSEWIQIDR